MLAPVVVLPNAAAQAGNKLPGTISRVALRADSSVVLVDNRDHTLTILNREGERVASGELREGAGQPYVYVSALALGVADSLLVYDEHSGRLNTLLSIGPHVRVVRAVKVQMNAMGMCRMRRSVYLLGYHEGLLIHEFDTKGKHLRSFGQAEGANETARSGALIGGAGILCEELTGTILLRVNASPILRAFGTTGVERWRYVIPDFRAIRTEVLGDGEIMMSRPEGGVDVTASAFAATGGVIAVQVARGRAGHRAPTKPSIETFALRASDGTRMATTWALPELTPVGQRAVAVIERSGEPTLRIWLASMAP